MMFKFSKKTKRSWKYTNPNVQDTLNNLMVPSLNQVSLLPQQCNTNDGSPIAQAHVEVDVVNEGELVRSSVDNQTNLTCGEGLLPGIEGLQIVGEAKLGSTLQACGFSINGTTICTFQWVRYLENGTKQYIEGATEPYYEVSIDDVDNLLAVECIPKDEGGNAGELVRSFANNQVKRTCEEELLPGVYGFQIVGEAKPGSTLRACGYSVNGTTHCEFQWIRYLENGTMQYIEGASKPDYEVTVDDVDNLLAVECIPLDDGGNKGKLVRSFANNQVKRTCEEGSLPGIYGFQIGGEAKPGSTLQACGYPINGITVCMFQWVRYLENGIKQYIQEATCPEYAVTIDDVNNLLGVECIPIDDGGNQGELLTIFVNMRMKISIDGNVHQEGENRISAGIPTFIYPHLKKVSLALKETSAKGQFMMILFLAVLFIRLFRLNVRIVTTGSNNNVEFQIEVRF